MPDSINILYSAYTTNQFQELRFVNLYKLIELEENLLHMARYVLFPSQFTEIQVYYQR